MADSTAGFSSVQGANNWYYGYFPGGNANAFTQLPNFYAPWNQWQHTVCCPPWTAVGAYSAMHPNGADSGGEEWAVREWVSNFDGAVTVSGQIYKNDTSPNSTGVYGRIYLNHTQIWIQFIAGTDGTGVRYSLPLTLHSGDVLDFALSPNGVDYNDSTIFSAAVASVYDNVAVDFGVSQSTTPGTGIFASLPPTSPPLNLVTQLQPNFWREAPDLGNNLLG